jgi:hypothetical protein
MTTTTTPNLINPEDYATKLEGAIFAIHLTLIPLPSVSTSGSTSTSTAPGPATSTSTSHSVSKAGPVADPHYSSLYRKLRSNLANSANKSLRDLVATGEISPLDLAKMDHTQLASEEQRVLIDKLRQQSITNVMRKTDDDGMKVVKKTHKGDVEVTVHTYIPEVSVKISDDEDEESGEVTGVTSNGDDDVKEEKKKLRKDKVKRETEKEKQKEAAQKSHSDIDKMDTEATSKSKPKSVFPAVSESDEPATSKKRSLVQSDGSATVTDGSSSKKKRTLKGSASTAKTSLLDTVLSDIMDTVNVEEIAEELGISDNPVVDFDTWRSNEGIASKSETEDVNESKKSRNVFSADEEPPVDGDEPMKQSEPTSLTSNTNTNTNAHTDTYNPHQSHGASSEVQPHHIWHGKVSFHELGFFNCVTRQVGGLPHGPPALWKLLLPDALDIVGRIPTKTAQDFLASMVDYPGRDIVVLQLDSTSTEYDQMMYQKFWEYLKQRDRFGVVSGHAHIAKEFYLVPLQMDEELPAWMNSLRNAQLLKHRRTKNLLLGIAVLKKSGVDKMKQQLEANKMAYQSHHHHPQHQQPQKVLRR